MDILSRIAEEKIKTAQEEGQFQGLAGMGRPLALDEDAHADPDWRLAHHILKTQGFVPDWVERRREILAEVERLRAALRQASTQAPEGSPMRQAALRQGEHALRALNRLIFDYNLQAPSLLLHISPLHPDREVAAALAWPGPAGGTGLADM